MLHAKFKDYRTIDIEKKILKGFNIYGHGSHLGHVTNSTSTNMCPHFPNEPP